MATNAGIAGFPAYVATGARSTVNPLVRAALYLFVLSIPFEFPGRSFPVEIPTIAAALFVLATLLEPRRCYARTPPALLFLHRT